MSPISFFDWLFLSFSEALLGIQCQFVLSNRIQYLGLNFSHIRQCTDIQYIMESQSNTEMEQSITITCTMMEDIHSQI